LYCQVAHYIFTLSSNDQRLENVLRDSFSGDKVCGESPGIVVYGVCKVVSKVLQWTLSGDNSLNKESKHREHSKSTVLDLLYLELSKCLWVFSKA
uniref:Uncharacterized protein n=1 Tax=Solanum lycopersicum TaxID=4081 RepID=A0A3Q7FNS0_SOLLC